MTVSVIIPCLNEEHYIGLLLEDLCRQIVKPEAVLVVDCASADKTIKAAKEFSKKLPLKILQSTFRSAAAARNTGANAAKTDYLLFLDADIRIKPGFIAKLKNKAVSKNVDFVTPRLSTTGRHPFDHIFAWCINLWVFVYRMFICRKASGVAGGAMLIKKSAHERIGGYNPKLREFDDMDYIHRMQTNHISYAFVWSAVAIASNRRLVAQGRLATLLQAIPEDYFFTRHFIRPLMKKIGLKPKWHDIK